MATENIRAKMLEHCQIQFNIDNIEVLTTKNVLELCSATSGTPCTLSDVAELLKYNTSAFRRRISEIKKKSSSLRGNKKQEYLNELFSENVPSGSSYMVKTKTETEALETVARQTEIETLNETISRLQHKLELGSNKNKKIESENTHLKVDNRRFKRQVASCRTLLKRKREQYNKLTTEVRLLKLKKGQKKQQTDSKKKNINPLEKCLQENSVVRANLEKEKSDILKYNEKLESEMKGKEAENNMLNESLKYVESLIQDNTSETIYTFEADRNCYSNDMQLCIMNLLSEGVGVHHVNKVIEHVSQLCGKSVSNLPSVSTINRICDQRASAAYMQISEQLTPKTDTTLQSDETRKHGDCYEIFSVRDDTNKEWVIGLKDMMDKSSDSCLETLKIILRDINECTHTNTGNMILTKIKNTMSDRAATEKKFHDILQSYREEILPAVYSNWDSMSAPEQESMARMNNFYCGLHLLVNFAEIANSVMKKFEANVKEGDLGAEAHSETKMFTKKDESSSVRLVRTACKCLARGGDDKSGCYLQFRTYMNQKDEDESRKKKSASLLVPFRGNRFNILFYNAEIVFYLVNDIIEFFEKVNMPTNRLQKAVLYDTKEKLHLAILKALGIFSKLVTAPFWRALEDKDCSLEKANTVYQSLFSFLERCQEDSSDVLCGTDAPLPDLVKKDEVYDRLMKADDYDNTTSAFLQQLFASCFTLLIKAAGDHLPGGKFAQVDKPLSEQTASVPRHNKFPERVFSMLDALTRYRPIASTLCNESYIMFSLNKTGDWLRTLPVDERNRLLDQSRKEGLEIRNKYKTRLSEIENTRRETLKKKRLAIEKKENEKFIHREELIDKMLFYGLWQYCETVDTQLKLMKTDYEKKKALKCQLQFRKVVLGQTGDQKLFQLSEKGVQYSVGKLADNVKTLIQSSLTLHTGEQRTLFLGKRIVHYQLVDKVRTPFHGRVISTVPGYPEWHNVIYDDDPAVYVYKLSDDYESGDLEISLEELVREKETETEPKKKKRRK